MLRRTPASPITLSLSTHGSLMPGWMSQHVAAVSGLSGIDVDATTPAGAWLAARCGSADDHYVKVQSIWVPFHAVQSHRNRKLVHTLTSRQPDNPPLVIAAMTTVLSARDLYRAVEPLRELARDRPVGIGISSHALRGGRPHLVQLGAIKHFAEEWDLALAVDLSGRFDPTWEAEAAVARLGDRLRVMRIRSTAPARSAVGPDRVACRALNALIDRGHFADIALSTARSGPFPAMPRTSAAAAHRAAEYIVERAELHAQALRQGIGHFEGSPTSRGG